MAYVDWGTKYTLFATQLATRLAEEDPRTIDIVQVVRHSLHARAIFGEQLGSSFSVTDTVARILKDSKLSLGTVMETPDAVGHVEGGAGEGAGQLAGGVPAGAAPEAVDAR